MNELGYNCLKKIIYRIKNNCYIPDDMSYSEDKFNIDDSIVFLLCLFFNTGYIFPEKLKDIDWYIGPNEFDSSIIINDEYSRDLYGEYTDDFVKRINSFLQILRNSAAHDSMRKGIDFEIEIKDDYNNRITIGYDNIYMLFHKLMSYIIFNYFGGNETFIVIEPEGKTYEELKNAYIEQYKDSDLYPFIKDIIEKVENFKYEDGDEDYFDSYYYDKGRISQEEIDKLMNKNGKIQDEDSWIKKKELCIYTEHLVESNEMYYALLNKFKSKFTDYSSIFDEIYRIYSIEDHSYDDVKTHAISGYIDFINDEFNELGEKLGVENYSVHSDKNNMYKIVLLTIIFGFGNWDNIDVNSIDLSCVKVNDSFNKSKNNNYDEEFIIHYKKFASINKEIQKTKDNEKIPEEAKNKIISGLYKKLDDVIDKIYEVKKVKESFNSNSNIIRHIRNSFCHGYYSINNNLIIIEDYSPEHIKTFECTVSINKLLSVVLHDNIIDSLYNSGKRRSYLDF